LLKYSLLEALLLLLCQRDKQHASFFFFLTSHVKFEASASLAKMAETSGAMSATVETAEETLTVMEKITKVSDAVSILSQLRACQRIVTQSHAWFYSAAPYLVSFFAPSTTGSP
jgi:hypothetical protein